MAARVLLLMALTGLFAAAWNSDSPDAANSPLVSSVVRPESQPVAAGYGQEWHVSDVSQTVTISHEFDHFAVSFPESITPGTYRIVDAEGRVGWMTIPVGDQPESASNKPEPFYTSQSETGRWYFIRVEAAPIIAAPHTGGSVLR